MKSHPCHHSVCLALANGFTENGKMPKFPNPCLVCGKLSRNGSRCEVHQAQLDQAHEARRARVKKETKQYSGSYNRLARIVRQTATQCAICKLGALPNDTWQADHIVPASEVYSLDQLQAVHASCNRARGNKAL